jgi:hypothetical protein
MNRLSVVAVGAVLFGASWAWADDTIEASIPSTDYGHNSQNATDNGEEDGTFLVEPTSGIPGAQKAPVACAPTATVNSFEMLQNVYGLSGLVGDDPFDAINELAGPDYMKTQDATLNDDPPPEYVGGGTSASNLVLGKENYLQDHLVQGTYVPGIGNVNAIQTVGQSIFFSQAANGTDQGGIQQTDPTAEFIAEQLEAGEDIEAWETWTDDEGNPTGGAHIITITGIDFDPDTNSGSLTFIDPFGGPEADSAEDITSNSLEIIDGQLVLGYTGGGAGHDEDPDNTDSTGFARLDMVVAESPVPEPVSASLVLFAGGILALRRNRRAV